MHPRPSFSWRRSASPARGGASQCPGRAGSLSSSRRPSGPPGLEQPGALVLSSAQPRGLGRATGRQGLRLSSSAGLEGVPADARAGVHGLALSVARRRRGGRDHPIGARLCVVVDRGAARRIRSDNRAPAALGSRSWTSGFSPVHHWRRSKTSASAWCLWSRHSEGDTAQSSVCYCILFM